MLYFITGNERKFMEAKQILPELVQLNMDLPEIQEIDPRKVIAAKLVEATKHHSGDFIVEDTSLCLNCLGGLPGPLIRWFEKSIGNDGLVRLTKSLGVTKATTRVVIGYYSGAKTEYFEGVLEGQIVEPRGEQDFGWGPIFQPEGQTKTFGEMEREEKNSLSMRRIALEKLRDHLTALRA